MFFFSLFSEIFLYSVSVKQIIQFRLNLHWTASTWVLRVLVNTWASKDFVARTGHVARTQRHTHAYIHICICIGGGGTEQVFELISFISPAATTRRPLAPRRSPCGPLIHRDRLRDIYFVYVSFWFYIWIQRVRVFRVYLVDMSRAFTCRKIHTIYLRYVRDEPRAG